MKIILSRKGFDSSSGGGPSPIVDGRAISLPIPDTQGISRTSYGALGLGDHAGRASRGRLTGHDNCHNDPMFTGAGRAYLGQCGAAQTHLANHGVGAGDLFVFFGLFRDGKAPAHHRIFGFLEIEQVVHLATCDAGQRGELVALDHPHALGMHASNDAVYCGRGVSNAPACSELRLTVPGGPPSLWQVPSWLHAAGLSYHSKPDRWLPDHRLQSVARGQEFVADVGDRKDAHRWAAQIIALIIG
ncbi:hypothetical protein [Aurantiacibacter marinus]|uniref:Nucleotide modification associated domain-containing protein n=1 Tax=Aurantiacibacter marinus TaxID=874156 RepID=A0A0H0XSH6_9SPHN|nr:hypothetical protein [Aurantiacibacter marinus]KLI64941.1 hypothetical protein AAV99_05470 [Aurantiacibacter marinus]